MSQHKHSYINKGGLLVPPGENIVHRRQGLPLKNSSQNHVVGAFFFTILECPTIQSFCLANFAEVIVLEFTVLPGASETIVYANFGGGGGGGQSVLWGIPK